MIDKDKLFAIMEDKGQTLEDVQQDLREESQTFTTFMINTDPSKDRRLADFTEQAELFSWFLFGREYVKLKRDA
jgi:hypothetical protein